MFSPICQQYQAKYESIGNKSAECCRCLASVGHKSKLLNIGLREDIHSPLKLQSKHRLAILKVYSVHGAVVPQLEKNAAFTICTEGLEKNPQCTD